MNNHNTIQDAMDSQKAEFDVLDELIKSYKNLPAIVDDDYPAMRHKYEGAMYRFIEAIKNNRRLNKPVKLNMFELHEKMTKHLFPTYSSTDERFLTLALCGEAGELANIIKKRWRDGVDLSEEAKDEIADIRVYLELLAKCFNIEGEKLDERVKQKLEKVVAKHGIK
jgi:NTP pyrophosphatase (non-canonical NTP hydrolase)